MSEPDPAQEERPILRIVRGGADDTEIAALTAALASAAAARTATASTPDGPVSVWADRSAALRHPAGNRPLRPGPHAWRTSALPR